MRRAIAAAILTFASWNVSALECAAPAVLKQADGPGSTLHSWCEADGKREGPYEVFAMEGGQQLHAEFKDGKLNGKFRRFKNGKVIAEGFYRDGKMDGEWTRYHEDGSQRDQGLWKDDHPIGPWKFADKDAGRTVDYDESGKPIDKTISDFNTRIELGAAHSEANTGGDTVFFAIGAERRLLHWSEWLRIDLTTRIFQEKFPNSHGGDISGQLGLSFDILRRVTRPFNLYFRLGPHLGKMDKMAMFFSPGIRYLPTSNRHWGGVFLELIHVDYDSDFNQNNYNPGPGPGNSSNMDNHVHTETFFLGTMYSF